jgi:hypothetical protein
MVINHPGPEKSINMEDYDTNWWNITTLLASLGF